MTTNMNGWDQLICSYFSKTCIDELAPILEKNEFVVAQIGPGGAVFFQRPGVFIEIGYELETAPKYSPTVIVGLGEQKYDVKGKPNGVPLWFVIRDDNPTETYFDWKFGSEAELRSVLVRIKDEVLEKQLKPLWQEAGLLNNLLSSFRSRLE